MASAGRAPGRAAPRAGLMLGRELELLACGFRAVVGIDEVGRGPLAGPVTAAAVILDADDLPEGLADSKVLPSELRDETCRHIMVRARAVGIGFATPDEIDRLNIRQATFLAMRRALASLALAPDYVLIDGSDLPGLPSRSGTGLLPAEAIIKGDATCASIAAASIVAKVARDRLMVRHHGHDPRYGFHKHKGYATAEHRDALKRHGASPFHRRSFAPCGTGQGDADQTRLDIDESGPAP